MGKMEDRAEEQARAVIEKFDDEHKRASKLERDNLKLRQKIDALMKNNQQMAKVLRILDNKMDEKKIIPRKNMLYSYQDGMMIKKEHINRKRLELKRKSADLDEINKQLNELLAIMKSRNINISPDDNNNIDK